MFQGSTVDIIHKACDDGTINTTVQISAVVTAMASVMNLIALAIGDDVLLEAMQYLFSAIGAGAAVSIFYFIKCNKIHQQTMDEKFIQWSTKLDLAISSQSACIINAIESLKQADKDRDRRWQETNTESDKRWQETKTESDKRWQETKTKSDKRWEDIKKESDIRWQEMREDSNKRWQEFRTDIKGDLAENADRIIAAITK